MSSSLLILMGNRNKTGFRLLIATSWGDLHQEFGHCQDGPALRKAFWDFV